MPDIFISPSRLTTSSGSPVNPEKKPLEIHTSLFDNRSLSSFMYMPASVKFTTQENSEKVILLLRKHWVTNLPWLITGIILILTPIFIFPIFIMNGLIPPDVPENYLYFSVFAWYLITFSFFFTNFLLWYFNVWIVTDKRLIDIDFINLLNKKFSETLISKIEDVTQRTGGIFGAFFDYGDLNAQTAAAKVEFEAFDIPHPEQVVRIINQLMGKETGGNK